MPQIEIGKFRDSGTGASPALDEVEAKLFDRVRQLASEVFQIRLDGPGSKVTHHPAGLPDANLLEKDGEYQIQLAMPGFEAKDIQMVATSGSIMFHAVASQKHENDFADSYSCEFGQKQIFRRFLLPKQVDVDGVTAQLEKNILQIRAPIKAVAAKAFAAAAGAGPSAISSPGLNQVMTIIRPYAAGPVTENTTLDDLGLSSLERLMLTMELELQLGILISDTESQALHSVGEIAQIMRSMTQ